MRHRWRTRHGFREAAGRLVNCFTPIGLDAYHLINSTCGAGNAFFVAITLALLATSANAQNCQFYGNQTHCDNGLSAQPLPSQSCGNSTYNSDGTSSQTYGHTAYGKSNSLQIDLWKAAPQLAASCRARAALARPKVEGGRRSNAYLVRCPSMAWQASWASASVSKGEPPILMALVF